MNLSERIAHLNEKSQGTLMGCLNISFVKYSEGCLTAEMPVNINTIQPFGILHGGATMALVESVGGALSFLEIDSKLEVPVGIEVNGNHLKSVKEGKVTAVARFLRKGNSIHVIDVRVTDDFENLISVGRITNKIIKREV